MKKILIIVAVVAVLAFLTIRPYNSLVVSREAVTKTWADVEAQYQRRADLIPNLVNTVKGVAEFEKSTLSAVIEARASATAVKIDANNLSEESIAKFQQAQGQLGAALGRLMAVSENYPQLKGTESFRDLQAQLEGTENRITQARNTYNDVANQYNAARATFPKVLFASLFGFKDKPYFKAEAGTEKAPSVQFTK